MTTTAPEETAPQSPPTAPDEPSFASAFEEEPEPGASSGSPETPVGEQIGEAPPGEAPPPGERLTWRQKQAQRKERQGLRAEDERRRAEQGRALEELSDMREKLARLEGAASARPAQAQPADLLEVVREHAKRKGVDIGTALQQVAEQIALDGQPGPMAALDEARSTKAEVAELREALKAREQREHAQAVRYEQEQVVSASAAYVEGVFAEDADDFPWLEYADPDELRADIDGVARHAMFVVPGTLTKDDLVKTLDKIYARRYGKIIHQGNGTRPVAGKDPQGTRNPGASSSKPGNGARTKPRTMTNRHQAANTSKSLEDMSDAEVDAAFSAALKEAMSAD